MILILSRVSPPSYPALMVLNVQTYPIIFVKDSQFANLLRIFVSRKYEERKTVRENVRLHVKNQHQIFTSNYKFLLNTNLDFRLHTTFCSYLSLAIRFTIPHIYILCKKTFSLTLNCSFYLLLALLVSLNPLSYFQGLQHFKNYIQI